MATKTLYPNSQAPAVPAGVAQIHYPEAGGRGGVPLSDPDDRIGDVAASSSSVDFVPNAMPRVAATPSEAQFADDVLALRKRLTDAIQRERATPQVAAVALMATAVDLTGVQPEEELRDKLEATAREFTGTGEEPSPIT